MLVCIAIEDLRFTVYQPLSLQGAGSLCIELGHVQGAAFVAGRRLSLQGAAFVAGRRLPFVCGAARTIRRAVRPPVWIKYRTVGSEKKTYSLPNLTGTKHFPGRRALLMV